MAAAAVGGVAMMVRATLRSADALKKVSDKLGIATRDLAGFHHAARLAGLATKTFDMAAQRMTRRVAEAAIGTGEARDAIRELGLDAKKLATAGPTAALYEVANALSHVENQSDRVRLAFKLFDSEGVAMVNMLQDGAGGLRRAMEEAKAFGTALSAVDLRKIENANDAVTRLRELVRGLATQVTVALTPALEAASTLMSDWGASGTLAADAVQTAMAKVGATIGWVADKVWELKKTFTQVGTGILLAVDAAYNAWLKFQTFMLDSTGPTGLIQDALDKAGLWQLSAGIDAARAMGNKKQTLFPEALKNAFENLKNLDREQKPSETLKEILANIKLASQQNAEAAEKARQAGQKTQQIAQAVGYGRGGSAPGGTFKAVDLTTTYIGRGTTTARKQPVHDEKGWAQQVLTNKLLGEIARGAKPAVVTQ
jgi:hypothetical protein